MSLTALVLVASGAAVSVAASSDAATPIANPAADPATNPPDNRATGPDGAGTATGKQNKVDRRRDPAVVAWARRYGMDRATMPTLAPVSAASATQREAATDLLARTKAATLQYNDPAKAKAAGFDLQARLAIQQRRKPGIAKRMQRVDASPATARGTAAMMPMLHVPNASFMTDGKLLDPNAPETLMYGYQGNGRWTVVGVMYRANEAYPAAPAVPGGPITRWHYHRGQPGLMMHLFFAPAGDLARAYATQMD